jgi:adenosylcobinamide kinase / adenosylcobinamide-phosphate guanylyltransferase
MAMTLLLGGAASGKSRVAAELAAGSGLPVVFVATAEALDDEMAVKIERHRAARPSDWLVVEEPIALTEAIGATPERAALIVDCLTLWVANLLGAGRTDDEVLAVATGSAAAAGGRPGPTLVVSNEVGSGIVPMEPESRRYRELLGVANALFADAADAVALLVAGRAVRLGEPITTLGAS